MTEASSRKEKSKEAKREAILNAAIELSEYVGYENMRVEQVAIDAGVSKGTVYLYFANKDALCAAVGERRMSEVVPKVLAAQSKAVDGLDAVRATLEVMFEDLNARPGMLRFFVGWISRPEVVDDHSPSFQSYRERCGAVTFAIRGAFERGKSDGTIRPDLDSLNHALLMFAQMVGVMLIRNSAENMQKRVPVPIDFHELHNRHLHSCLMSCASDLARPRLSSLLSTSANAAVADSAQPNSTLSLSNEPDSPKTKAS